jgi:cytochrome c-type biogenesis protein CcmE
MNKRVKFVIGGTIIVALLGYLVVSGINSRTMVYYKTVSEVKANSDDLYEKGIRLSGTVVEGSLKKNSKTLDYSFTLSEEGAEIPVRYHGVLPDIFKEGNEAVVEGKIRQDHTFEATHVFTKCPSKYEGEELTGEETGY